MARKISIEIVAQDNFSGTIKSMRGMVQKFNSDLNSLSDKLDYINKKKFKVNADTKDAQNNLKQMVSDIDAVKKAADKLNNGTITQGTAAMVVNNEKATKSFQGLKKVISDSGIEGEIKKQFGGMAVGTVTNAATTYANSAFGTEGGALAGNALSTGVLGAQLGFAMGGPVGAAVGGVLGAGLGLINGALENYANKDDAFKDYVGKQYEGIVQERSSMVADASSLAANQDSETAKAFQEATDRLNQVNNENATAAGDAYNTARIGEENGVITEGGLADQADFYGSGGKGAAIAEIDKNYAEAMAKLENKKNEYQMGAEEALLTGNVSGLSKAGYSDESITRLETMNSEFNAAANDPIKQKALLDEARAIASNEYAGDKDVQHAQEADKELVTNLQASAKANDAGWKNVYDIKGELSKGRASVEPNEVKTNNPRGLYGKAYGLSYVPYDDFPAMLHEGERVLTASESRSYKNGAGVTITGNNFTVREETDIQKIASALFREIEKTRMVMAY